VKRRDLIAHLEAHGCRLVREGAKYTWCPSPDKHRQRWQIAKGDTLADAKAERDGRRLHRVGLPFAPVAPARSIGPAASDE
jgi:hypothetical protein